MNVTRHSALKWSSHWPLHLLMFNTPWKEFREEVRNEVLCALGKLADRPSDRYFLQKFFFFSFKNLFVYFNWRLIILQYCSGFCHKLTWISHRYTCVPHPEPPSHLPSPSHPSGSSQCTGPEHLVLCIKPGLVICFTFGNIHVSMLFSQIISPLPSLTESKSQFCISVSFAFSHIGSSLPSF